MDLTKLGQRLEEEIEKAEKEATQDGRIFRPRKIELKVCGQIGLMADEFLSKKIELESTRDFDAFKVATQEVEIILKKVLKEFGLFFDELSDEIWMPADTEWEEIFKGENVLILKARAIDVLVSKAIKAKEKNRILIKKSLLIYGDELRDRILFHGGDPNEFE